MKKSIIFGIFALLLIVAGVAGEVKCVVKAFGCNWEPIGKAEVIYTAASLTGFGAIVGWFDVKDK